MRSGGGRWGKGSEHFCPKFSIKISVAKMTKLWTKSSYFSLYIEAGSVTRPRQFRTFVDIEIIHDSSLSVNFMSSFPKTSNNLIVSRLTRKLTSPVQPQQHWHGQHGPPMLSTSLWSSSNTEYLGFHQLNLQVLHLKMLLKIPDDWANV